jgi:hypothetical protein
MLSLTHPRCIGSRWVRQLHFPHSIVFKGIQTVLHPQHKLSYFAKVGWEAEWITTVREIVRAEFDRSYASSSGELNVSETAEASTTTVQASRFFAPLHQRG